MKNITKTDDGKYRWEYELNLFKNPTVLLLIWKIFFFIILGIFAFVNVFDFFNWKDNFFPEMFLNNIKFLGFFIVGMTALVLISYVIYALIMGGKYIVEFEMDERGVLHKQTESQAKKARKIGRLTSAAGSASGNLTTVGVGINAQRTEMYSEFSKVKKVKAYKNRNLIKIAETLEHNQVYTSSEDFDFVLDYIISHCENLKN